ncbi:hypothetical protein [Alkalicoccobacillus gibsonii]|uniref:hypothetical protein n=1 Tax=Alkalicoccobacillus gibsonii TaxID=79881 RepID=UPI003519D261
MPDGFFVCLILSILLLIIAYGLGIKKNLSFVIVFSLGFSRNLIKANHDQIAKRLGIYSLIMAFTFLSMPFLISFLGENIVFLYVAFILMTTVVTLLHTTKLNRQ